MSPVTIIVVLYRSAGAIPGLLACLQSQTASEWSLIAVDNGGDTAARLLHDAQDPRISVLTSPGNIGFARAANTGLRHALAQGALRTLLLNPDTHFGPEFLDLLDRSWTGHEAPVIAPRIMLAEDPGRAWYAGGHFDREWAFLNIHEPHDPYGPPTRTVAFASGCCLGITAETWRTVGLFDEQFFLYWEDSDLCLRLEAAGIPILYAADPVIFHEGGASSDGERSPAALRLYNRSYTRFLRKHFGIVTALRTTARLWLKHGPTRPGATRQLSNHLRGLVG